MLGLAIFLGVIALLWLLLRIPVVVTADYSDGLTARARWLFLRFALFPQPAKKPKKKKKKKAEPEKKEEEKPKQEGAKEPGIVARFYEYQGIQGFLALLRELANVLQKFGHGVGRSIRVRRFDLQIVVTGGEPAELAEKYGKTSAAAFSSLGYLSSHVRISRRCRHRIDIHPDFTGWDKKQVQCGATLAITPSTLLLAVLALAVRLVLRVLLRFLKGAKPPKAKPAKQTSST